MARVSTGTNKKEDIAHQVAKLVGAGKNVALETVDFSDPNRPRTCLEVDFPIIPVNRVAIIEGNAGKPIYQMSKWWARRRSTIFRSLLLAAATKAPEDETKAAKVIWDAYYANHQNKGAFKHLKVADIFMGGGTTIVEGSRLGMQMYGNDLNPVAWFIVQNSLAEIDANEVKIFLSHIEKEVKAQIMPYYAIDCPRGHKGQWKYLIDNKIMPVDFDPSTIKISDRDKYSYLGPEIIYTFWIKHGPCLVPDCQHNTPLFSSPIIATKQITIKAWTNQKCSNCNEIFDVEEQEARMAPGVPLVILDSETPYAVLGDRLRTSCPFCKHIFTPQLPSKSDKKKINLSLLINPIWFQGSPERNVSGESLGGSATSGPKETIEWNNLRKNNLNFIEIRGENIPEEIKSPISDEMISTTIGTITKQSTFKCSKCGHNGNILNSIKRTNTTGRTFPILVQGYCPCCDSDGQSYGGRFFLPTTEINRINSCVNEWNTRKTTDLACFWPEDELSKGWKTHDWGIPDHGYTHYWKMFNERQLLSNSLLLKHIVNSHYKKSTKQFVLGVFQQFLRNNCVFAFWNIGADKLEPHFSHNYFDPKNMYIENNLFAKKATGRSIGRGNWLACSESIVETADWKENPWELVSKDQIALQDKDLADFIPPSASSIKVYPGDRCIGNQHLTCSSSTDLSTIANNSMDLIITDPPFGQNIQYAELSDFFYVWLKKGVVDEPHFLTVNGYSPKALEAVTNPYRNEGDPEGFYKSTLQACWSEAARILKPHGLMAFTFHHHAEGSWISVLESLFEAGFYLVSTFPVRADESKGGFGAQKIEFDIVHVCRRRTEAPTPVTWAAMRKAVVEDVKHLQMLLEHHEMEGLPKEDLREIKRGKALEYYSRHFGQVWLDEDRVLDVKSALVGIHDLLQEDSTLGADPIPPQVEPYTSQFLRLFDGVTCKPRDQVLKYFKGTGVSPDEFTNRDWCEEDRGAKEYRLVDPLVYAKGWINRPRTKLTYDYDQALVLIGMCMPGSGLKVQETLDNPNFKAQPALAPLLDWLARKGPTLPFRTAAQAAHLLLQASLRKRQGRSTGQQQPALFDDI